MAANALENATNEIARLREQLYHSEGAKLEAEEKLLYFQHSFGIDNEGYHRKGRELLRPLKDLYPTPTNEEFVLVFTPDYELGSGNYDLVRIIDLVYPNPDDDNTWLEKAKFMHLPGVFYEDEGFIDYALEQLYQRDLENELTDLYNLIFSDTGFSKDKLDKQEPVQNPLSFSPKPVPASFAAAVKVILAMREKLINTELTLANAKKKIADDSWGDTKWGA